MKKVVFILMALALFTSCQEKAPAPQEAEVVEVDPRSRPQDQRSRPNMKVCKKLVSTIRHELVIGS